MTIMGKAIVKAFGASGSWSDGCLYKCQECWQYETTSIRDFSEHLLTEHLTSNDEYEV